MWGGCPYTVGMLSGEYSEAIWSLCKCCHEVMERMSGCVGRISGEYSEGIWTVWEIYLESVGRVYEGC